MATSPTTSTHESTLATLRGQVSADATTQSEIREAFASVDARMVALLSELQELRASEATEKARLETNAAAAPKTIKLNVGGKIFETSKDNLLRDADSFFYAMVTSETWQPRARDGAYFIDSNGTFFDRVLALLRTGVLDIDGLTESARSQLMETFRTVAMEAFLPTKQSGFGFSYPVASPFDVARTSAFPTPESGVDTESIRAFGTPNSGLGPAPTSGFGASLPLAACNLVPPLGAISLACDGVPSPAKNSPDASIDTLAATLQRIRKKEKARQRSINKTANDYERAATAIEADIAVLRVVRSRRNTIQKLTQAQAAIADNTIRLNVGGTLFETSRATLLALPDSYFTAMLSQGHWTPREVDGAYFIDQDATYFEYALDALRQGSLNTKGLPPTALQQLHFLLNYLQMDSLMEAS